MVHLNLICRLLYMNDYEAVFNFSSQIERFVQTLFCSTHQRIFIYKAPFLFVEVCRKPQPHGLLQWAAPAGVWRGAITAETQVTVSLLKRPPDPRESCKQRSFGHNQYQLKQDRCELAVRRVLTMSRAPASTWKAGCTCNPTLKTQKTPWGLLTRSPWLRTQQAGGQLGKAPMLTLASTHTVIFKDVLDRKLPVILRQTAAGLSLSHQPAPQ